MKKIFISYRRTDTQAWAHLIHDSLIKHFSSNLVFYDLDSMEIGQWNQQIISSIRSCRVMLVLIGEHWVNDRLFDENDVHRKEILEALNHQLMIVPISMPGVDLPSLQSLPDVLHELLSFEVLRLSEKPSQRKIQLEKLARQIRSQQGVPLKKKYSKAVVLIALSSLSVFLVFSLLAAPGFLANQRAIDLRERWEQHYQDKYEMLGVELVKKTFEEVSASGVAPKEMIPEAFKVMHEKIKSSDVASSEIPQYVVFLDEWLECLNTKKCQNQSVEKFFDEKVLEVWGNYRCWINDLRDDGKPLNFGKSLQSYYEDHPKIQERRNAANKQRMRNINNALELCP